MFLKLINEAELIYNYNNRKWYTKSYNPLYRIAL